MIMEILNGWQIGVEPGREMVVENGMPVLDADGPRMVPIWTLIMMEMNPPTGRQIRIGLSQEVKDSLVQMLTGGIVIPSNGSVPHASPVV